MTALTGDRNTPRLQGDIASEPVAAYTTIYAGAQVVLNAARFAAPGSTATGLLAIGRAEEHVVNTGADGAKRVRVRRGTFQWANSAGADEIARADIGAAAYIVDDQTVAKTDATGTRSAAGIIRGVDDVGVWVEV